MAIKRSKNPKVEERKPDLYHPKTLSKEQLLSIVRLVDSKDGQVLLTLLDGYIFNRTLDVFYNRDIHAESHLANASFDQGRGAGAAELRYLLRTAKQELERREDK